MAKKREGFSLPPVDASPEEIAKAMFTFDPTDQRHVEGRRQAALRHPGEPLTIKIPEGGVVHQWLEEQEAEARRREEEQSK